jgi:hypothetical protein
MTGFHAVALRGAPTIARRHVVAARDLPIIGTAYGEYDNERHVDGVA